MQNYFMVFFPDYSWFYSLFSWMEHFIFWSIPRCALLSRLLLLTAQMQWTGINMFPLLVWCYSESVLELLGWPVGISYNSLIWRIFDRMEKAFSKRLSIPQNLTANTESFRIAIRLQNFYNQLPTLTTKSGWDVSVWSNNPNLFSCFNIIILI